MRKKWSYISVSSSQIFGRHCHGSISPRGSEVKFTTAAVHHRYTYRNQHPIHLIIVCSKPEANLPLTPPPPVTLAQSSTGSGVMPPDKVPHQSHQPLGHCDIWWEEQCHSCLTWPFTKASSALCQGIHPCLYFLPNSNLKLNLHSWLKAVMMLSVRKMCLYWWQQKCVCNLQSMWCMNEWRHRMSRINV